MMEMPVEMAHHFPGGTVASTDELISNPALPSVALLGTIACETSFFT
jgi:hypothetical protein